MKYSALIILAIYTQTVGFGQGLNTEIGYNPSYNQYPTAISSSNEYSYMSWDLSTEFGYGPVLDKIDTNGLVLWSIAVSPVPTAQNFVNEIISSFDGGVYVAGHSMSGCDVSSDCKMYLHKYSASGNSEWTTTMEIGFCDLNPGGFSILDDTLLMFCKNPYTGMNKIYQVDTSGLLLDSIEVAQSDILGVERFGGSDYIAYNSDSVFTFDQNGTLLQYINFDTTVADISMRNDTLFVLSEDSIMLFNNSFTLLDAESLVGYGNVEELKTKTGMVRFVGHFINQIVLYTMDEQLQLVNSTTMDTPNDYNKIVDYTVDHLSVGYRFPLTQHNSIRYLNFSLLDAANEFFSSSDVGIIDFEINDMTVSSSQADLYSVNFYVTAQVKNYGPNTVTSLRINKPFMQWICNYIYYTEDHDNIIIDSGDSLWIDLGWIGNFTYYVPNVDTLVVPLCVFTSHPNHFTDLTVGNDEFCKDVVIGYLGDEEHGLSKPQIYPNPSNGQFIIQFENPIESKVVITDIAGKLIFENIYSTDKIEMDLASWVAEGTYFLTILSPEGQLIVTNKIQVIR